MGQDAAAKAQRTGDAVGDGTSTSTILAQAIFADGVRNVVAGDPSPDGKGPLAIERGIEVGHVFYLGTKYSKAMNATFLDENGKPQAMKGYNDDLMISAALGCWIKDTFISPGELGANLDRMMLDNMKVFGHMNTEINGATKKMNVYSKLTQHGLHIV